MPTSSRFVAGCVLPWNLNDIEVLYRQMGYISGLKSDHEPRISWEWFFLVLA